MATSSTSGVYIHVIEDVISKVRDEFILDGGPGVAVLNELQGLWELKMMHAGAVCGPIERSSVSKSIPGGQITPVGDLNVPYEGTEEYETPTAEMLFPPTPLQTPIQTPLPGVGDNSSYNIHTGPSDYVVPHDINVNEVKPGRPSPYMQPPSHWMIQKPPLGVDVNVAYVENRDELDRGTSHQPLTQDFLMMASGKRKREDFASQYRPGGYIPQQDGAGDITLEFSHTQKNAPRNSSAELTEGNRGMVGRTSIRLSSQIPQLDGPADAYDDVLSTPNIYNFPGGVKESYNGGSTPLPNDIHAGTPILAIKNDTEDEDDEPSLNEDDDDDLDDVGDGEELNTPHLVLAQFDKVTRTKSRWKCTLKDGIMHINNKDILFNKANGEFEF